MAAPRVAVVGGGLAGLAAAKALLSEGVACTLLDMGGRGVGGRVASRQLEFGKKALPLSFDDGAQFFLAASPDFRAEVAGWAAAGAAAEWRSRQGRITADGAFVPSHEDGSSASGSASAGGESDFFAASSQQPRWVGVPTNSAIPQHMAASLLAQYGQQPGPQGRPLFELLSGTKVQAMERLGGGCGCGGGGLRWQLRGRRAGPPCAGTAAPPEQQQQQEEDLGAFDAAILADAGPLLPGRPARVEGIEAGSSSLAQLARSVQDVAAAAQPRFALMLAFSQPLPGVPFDFATVEHASGGEGGEGEAPSGARSCESCGCGACGSGFGGAFHLVSCNSSKPGRPGSGFGGAAAGAEAADAPQCWVAMTTAQRAVALMEQHGSKHGAHTPEFKAAVIEELLADFRDVMAPFVQGYFLPQPAFIDLKLWRRAFVIEPLGAEFLFLPAQKLALCGDAAIGSGVENAWRSGRAAGAAVGRMLRSAAGSSAN